MDSYSGRPGSRSASPDAIQPSDLTEGGDNQLCIDNYTRSLGRSERLLVRLLRGQSDANFPLWNYAGCWKVSAYRLVWSREDDAFIAEPLVNYYGATFCHA